MKVATRAFRELPIGRRRLHLRRLVANMLFCVSSFACFQPLIKVRQSAMIATFLLLVACGPVAESSGVPPVTMGDAAVTSPDAADGAREFVKPIDPGCQAPPGVSTAPQTIEDTVSLINALKAQQEGPLTLPCFLQSLSRPFAALATKSVFSAQPAIGSRNPRFFILSERLVMSVVPSGAGRPLLELAAYTTATRSIKAEVYFPVDAALTSDDPYVRVRYGEKTSCGACHSFEERVEGVSGADRFVSDVLRPRLSELVSLDFVRAEAEACVSDVDPERCAMLAALFAHGEMTLGAFSPQARTIYGDPTPPP